MNEKASCITINCGCCGNGSGGEVPYHQSVRMETDGLVIRIPVSPRRDQQE